MACRNVGKSWCDGSASVDSTHAGKSECAGNESATTWTATGRRRRVKATLAGRRRSGGAARRRAMAG
jgi:hypothetical protein